MVKNSEGLSSRNEPPRRSHMTLRSKHYCDALALSMYTCINNTMEIVKTFNNYITSTVFYTLSLKNIRSSAFEQVK